MKAEALDRKIDIYTQVPNQNIYGEMTYVDALLASVSAQVVPIGGRETFMAAQMVPEAQFKIVIRHRDGITTKHTVKFEGNTYDILHISEIGRREGLELLVKQP